LQHLTQGRVEITLADHKVHGQYSFLSQLEAGQRTMARLSRNLDVLIVAVVPKTALVEQVALWFAPMSPSSP
jgi:hypothetical protein